MEISGFDLEVFCMQPRRVLPLCSELAGTLRQFDVEFICGPLVEGAFVGLLVASELSTAFCYSERFARPSAGGLFRAGYRLPGTLGGAGQGKQVAIVNDVINTGSAVRGTFEELAACEPHVVAIRVLLTLGSAAEEFAKSKNVALKSLTAIANTLWTPSECPLCTARVPLEDVADFRYSFPDIAHA